MATNDGLEPKQANEPWWSQAKTAGESGSSIKPAQGGSTVSYVGGTLAQTSGQMGMPTEFGRYRVRKQLGGGGMGAVYLVENTELKREEALKVPHFGVGDDPEVRERFLREARAAAQLDHANLCPVYDVGTINGVCFLTMRYLKGKLLSDYTGKPQPARKAVEITAKLAQALESAHAKGVIHRDLKPNNVMMCAGVGPVVMDFGLAKQTKSEDQKLTQAGTTMGTPSYMPPEQIKGELDRIGPASDVYSLGVILYEMLTGRLPFKAPTIGEVYGLVLHTDAPAPSSLRPGLDPALDAICAKALAKKPEGRYPSMKAFAAALIDFLKTAPVGEGAGNLTPMKAGPADIFQVQTVVPSQAARRHGPRGETTQRGSKAPLLIRQPARTQLAKPLVTVYGAEKKDGRSKARVLVLAALIALIIGALGGLGFLVYAVHAGLGSGEAAKKSEKETPVSSVEPTSAKPPTSGGPVRVIPIPTDAVTLVPPAQDVDHRSLWQFLPQNGNGYFRSLNDGKWEEIGRAGERMGIWEEMGRTSEYVELYDPRRNYNTRLGTGWAKMGAGRNASEFNPSLGGTWVEVPRPVVQTAPIAKVDPQRIPLTPSGANVVPAIAPRKPDPNETVLVSEDFAGLDVGGRPKGWNAPDFGVAMEENRPCLEVTKDSSKLFHATLPKMEINGDFEMDCEFRLGGANIPALLGLGFTQHPTVGQQFRLELTGTGSTPLHVDVDTLGKVQINAGQKKQADGYKPAASNTLRLTRKGDVYNVSINDNEAIVGQTVSHSGVIQAAKIGLTGTKPFNGYFPACLYSVKITSIESTDLKLAGVVITAPPARIYQDFTKAAVGRLPEGWEVGKTPNLTVRKTLDLTALELTNPDLGTYQVTLPKVELKGDFNAAVAAVLVDRDTAVEVLFKGAKAEMLAVKLDYGGAVTAADLTKMDGRGSWREGKPNLLRIERSAKDKGYVIKLNDSEVGSVPLTAAPGPFTQVKLAVIAVKGAKQLSPQVTSVEVVPLE